jgi:hypothetical protein
MAKANSNYIAYYLLNLKLLITLVNPYGWANIKADAILYFLGSLWVKTPPVIRNIIITKFVTRLTWRVSLVEHELPTLLEHFSSPRFLQEFMLLDL